MKATVSAAVLKTHSRNYLMGTAFALVLTASAHVQQAQAQACTTVGITVTCTGAVVNPLGNGFGTGVESHLNITVGSPTDHASSVIGNSGFDGNGQTVTGNGVALGGYLQGTGLNNTVTNFGTINGATDGDGIVTGDGSVIHNSGTIGVANGVYSTLGIDGQGRNNTITVDNSGLITGSAVGLQAEGNLNLSNTGKISGGTDGVDVLRYGIITNRATGLITGVQVGIGPVTYSGGNYHGFGNLLTITNAGTIQGGQFGISGYGVTVANTGTITSPHTAISSYLNAFITNAGTIQGGHDAIYATQGALIRNNQGGQILANDRAIYVLSDGLVVTNNGLISAAAGVAISGGSNAAANVTNGSTGVITGNSAGINVEAMSVTNAGLITATGANGRAIFAGDEAFVTNNAGGQILATTSGGIAIFATNSASVLANAGTISGDLNAISADVVTVVGNTGLISSNTSDAITGATSVNVINNVGGRIMSTSGTGVATAGGMTVVNAGLISGMLGLQAGGAAIITNAGTITGTAGTAIKLSDADDTLNIKINSKINGAIDLGGGTNTINVDVPPAGARGVSVLSRAVSAIIDPLKQQIVNFDPLNDIINIVMAKSVQPTVTVNGVTAGIDPTALAQQDRVLMDVAGGVSTTVQGRLGASSSAPGVQMMSYAMDSQMDENALGYAGEARNASSLNAKAQMFTKASMFTKAPSAAAPINVWTAGFGGVRYQQGTDTTLNSTSSVFGGTFGVDRQMRPDLLVGLFAGGGGSNLTVEQGSQKIDSDYVFGGAYAHKTWGASFVDTTLQVGGITNRSDRLVQNAITGGLEHGAATSHGWFISPEVAYGYHLNVGHGYTLTPIARARYVAGFFDGYNESGSTQTLSIGNRTLQDFEERAELEFSRAGLFGNSALKTTLHGGFIGLQRVGDTNISAVLIGQGLTFATPGHASAAGGAFGASFDYAVAPNMVVFGAAEGQFMSDQSQTVSARGGFKVVF
jgi:hypothetical protein